MCVKQSVASSSECDNTAAIIGGVVAVVYTNTCDHSDCDSCSVLEEVQRKVFHF